MVDPIAITFTFTFTVAIKDYNDPRRRRLQPATTRPILIRMLSRHAPLPLLLSLLLMWAQLLAVSAPMPTGAAARAATASHQSTHCAQGAHRLPSPSRCPHHHAVPLCAVACALGAAASVVVPGGFVLPPPGGVVHAFVPGDRWHVAASSPSPLLRPPIALSV